MHLLVCLGPQILYISDHKFYKCLAYMVTRLLSDYTSYVVSNTCCLYNINKSKHYGIFGMFNTGLMDHVARLFIYISNIYILMDQSVLVNEVDGT